MLDLIKPIDYEFECKNPSYTDYYRVNAFSDPKEEMGQIWLCMYKKKMIGFITISMAHMMPKRDTRLQGKGYGDIPALLIRHTATHKDYEKRGGWKQIS